MFVGIREISIGYFGVRGKLIWESMGSRDKEITRNKEDPVAPTQSN